jgi:hypothetical protein
MEKLINFLMFIGCIIYTLVLIYFINNDIDISSVENWGFALAGTFFIYSAYEMIAWRKDR